MVVCVCVYRKWNKNPKWIDIWFVWKQKHLSPTNKTFGVTEKLQCSHQNTNTRTNNKHEKWNRKFKMNGNKNCARSKNQNQKEEKTTDQNEHWHSLTVCELTAIVINSQSEAIRRRRRWNVEKTKMWKFCCLASSTWCEREPERNRVNESTGRENRKENARTEKLKP